MVTSGAISSTTRSGGQRRHDGPELAVATLGLRAATRDAVGCAYRTDGGVGAVPEETAAMGAAGLSDYGGELERVDGCK